MGNFNSSSVACYNCYMYHSLGVIIMASPVAVRVQNHRNHLRASGFRPVQIWVRDTRTDDFEQECKRQMMVVSASDKSDLELQDFMNSALDDASAWQ